jgi:hypothetical protein
VKLLGQGAASATVDVEGKASGERHCRARWREADGGARACEREGEGACVQRHRGKKMERVGPWGMDKREVK